jgi:hypothetical protein
VKITHQRLLLSETAVSLILSVHFEIQNSLHTSGTGLTTDDQDSPWFTYSLSAHTTLMIPLVAPRKYISSVMEDPHIVHWGYQ